MKITFYNSTKNFESRSMKIIINKSQFAMLRRFNNAIIQFVTFQIVLSNIDVILFVNLLIINIALSKSSTDKENAMIKLNVNV